jgi:hypothetical protein
MTNGILRPNGSVQLALGAFTVGGETWIHEIKRSLLSLA